MNPNDPLPGQFPPEALPGTLPPASPNAYTATPSPYPPMTPPSHSGHNPYEFIIAPTPKPKRGLFGNSPNSAKKYLLKVAAIGILVIILGSIVASLLPNSIPTQSLTDIAQQQQELMRVANQGEARATGETARGLAYTIDLSIGTNQTQLLGYLAKHGTKLSTKTLSLKHSLTTDTTLSASLASSTYDSTFENIIATQLQDYLTSLQQTYNTTTKPDLRQILSTSFSAGTKLLNEIQTIQNQSQ